MNKTTFLAVALSSVLSSLLFSCDKFTEEEADVKYIPVQLSKDGAWSFINDKGEKVGTQQWEFRPSTTIGNLFSVKVNNKITVFQWKGDEAFPIDSLSDLISVGIYSEGLLPVAPKMHRIRIVDGKGNMKFQLDPVDGKEIVSCHPRFKEDKLIFYIDGYKAGVMDSKGNIIVKPQFNEISDFNGGYALARNFDETGEEGPSYFVIDKDGKITPIKHKFGWSEEGECGDMPAFDNGSVLISGYINENYETMKVSTDGSLTPVPEGEWIQQLPNNSKIISHNNYDSSYYTWEDADGKLILKTGDNKYLYSYGKYVELSGYGDNKQTVVFNEDGKELIKLNDNYSLSWPGGNFGPILMKYNDSDYSYSYKLYDVEGEPVGSTFYGLNLNGNVSMFEDEVCDNESFVISGYIDTVAAATKILAMLENGVKDDYDYYYLGMPLANIIRRQSYYYPGASIHISGPNNNYAMDEGTGFSINAEAIPSKKSPVTLKALNFHINTSAPSGDILKEAVERRLENAGYTKVSSNTSYDHYKNGYNDVVVYGNEKSHGIGVWKESSDSFSMSDTEKAGLATSIY